MTDKVEEAAPGPCGNCAGKGYDIIGLKGAGGRIYTRVCHVCKEANVVALVKLREKNQ